MSYGNEKVKFGKEHIIIVDLLLNGCSQTAGTSPCLATATGDDKCFNTLESCNFLEAFTPNSTVNHLRFYQARTPAPIGLAGSTTIDPIPCLKSVNIAPTKIDLSGGLGVRASVTCTFADFPHSDIGIDKYIDDRTYIASDRGTFWTKLRARNPDYQNKELRVLSGFLVDGVFDINNFTTRYYIIDKMTVTNGACTIVAKDPLKLASSKKAQAPAPSTGQLSADLLAAGTSFDLEPVGVGDLEYPESGKVLINSEVMSFTRSVGSDTLNITSRGSNNTIASDHANKNTVQLCLEYDSKKVDYIVHDLLTNYANINPSFINQGEWASEVNDWLSGTLSGIVVKPFDVFKLLKELAESMPHYLWWDERQTKAGGKGKVRLTALRRPETAAVINMDDNIIADSFKTADRPDMRKSTILVNFGQFDPTKSLDEISNYQQSYARVDNDSISKYGSNEIKTINSRWISNTDKASALQLAELIGRRFSDIPRDVSFSLEVKDSGYWAGQSITANHRDIVDFTGLPVNTVYQLLSVQESNNFKYTGLEFTYGAELDEDEGGGDPNVQLIIINANENNVNLYDRYVNNEGQAPTATTNAKFLIEDNAIVGSNSTSTYAIETGPSGVGGWPAGSTITIELRSGSYIVGKGGDGAGYGESTAGDGGNAIKLEHPVTLFNFGVIGGGGGGGGYADALDPPFEDTAKAGGGGGAGSVAGVAGASTGTPASATPTTVVNATNGTPATGGSGGEVIITSSNQLISKGGSGGDLGVDGQAGQVGVLLGSFGAAGDAFHFDGGTLTIDPSSRGDIFPPIP